MGLLNRVKDYFFCRRWRYVFSKSIVRVQPKARMDVGKNVLIRNSKIFVDVDSSVKISEGVQIDNAEIYVKGKLCIGSYTIIGQTQHSRSVITIEEGHVKIGHHSKISCSRVWVRFGGKVKIGDFTNYNEGGEIRADELVSIGNYGMISYKVNIWDTNTHSIYLPEKRHEITEKYWPYFGKEIERPQTSPVLIGNDAWIGENVSILKGTMIGDNVIVGYGTTLVNKTIESGRSVVTESNIRFIR